MSAAMTPGLAPRSHSLMTFGELLNDRPRRHSGITCRYCHEYGVTGVTYSTRHSVCIPCAKARADQKLPFVARREREAIKLAKQEHYKPSLGTIRAITGVNEDFAKWALAKAGVQS